jgi:hypothetical protein
MKNKTKQELSEMDWIDILAYRIERDGIIIGTSKTMPIGEMQIKGVNYQIQLRLENSKDLWIEEGDDVQSVGKIVSVNDL